MATDLKKIFTKNLKMAKMEWKRGLFLYKEVQSFSFLSFVDAGLDR